MQHHVRLQRAHEQDCGGTRIAAANDSRLHRSAEVVGDHDQPAPGRAVGGVSIERNDHRAGAIMHVDRDVFGDDFFDKRDELLGDGAKDDARVDPGIDSRKLEDEVRRGRQATAHRDSKEILFRIDVP